MSSASEKANLARIRDNQRRSRARRKEYLQELETKLRQCELQGIEASAEIQAAARRVADENKRLRALLAQCGMGDENVEAYLQSPAITSSVTPDHQQGSSDSTVHVLEQLLQVRRSCCAEGNTGAPTQSRAELDGNRDSSGSQSTTQAQWNTANPQKHLLQPESRPVSSSLFLTPSTSGNLVNNASSGHASDYGTTQSRSITPISMPQDWSPSSSSNYMRPDSHRYDFEPTQYLAQNAYTPQHSGGDPARRRQSNNNNNMLGTSQHQTPSYALTNSSSSSRFNISSCNVATDMIASMGGDPADVRADLGCLPGMDCDVDNQRIFAVIDRYSEQAR